MPQWGVRILCRRLFHNQPQVPLIPFLDRYEQDYDADAGEWVWHCAKNVHATALDALMASDGRAMVGCEGELM